MWLPRSLRARRAVWDRSVADVFERVLNKGVVVDFGAPLTALDVAIAAVPTVGARELPRLAGREPTQPRRRVTRRKRARRR